jgi:hypothetical protein
VGDILGRLDELESAVRRRPPQRPTSARRRAAPWIALASVILIIAFIALIVLLYANGTHQYTNKPGLQ